MKHTESTSFFGIDNLLIVISGILVLIVIVGVVLIIHYDNERHRMVVWDSKYGAILSVIGDDVTQISRDGNNDDSTALEAACHKFSDNLTQALGLPKMPDSEAALHFTSGLTFYKMSAKDCVVGSSDYINAVANGSTTLFSQSQSELQTSITALRQGNMQIQDTTNEINKLNK